MRIESYWICDLCRKNFGDRRPRNDIGIINGDNSRIFSEVCDRCIESMVELINEKFPRNIKALSQEI